MDLYRTGSCRVTMQMSVQVTSPDQAASVRSDVTSDVVLLKINNPNNQRFSLSVTTYVGSANRAPQFDSVDTITVFPGSKATVALSATDQQFPVRGGFVDRGSFRSCVRSSVLDFEWF